MTGNIKNMHYDFKVKLNRLDSAQYRNLQVPEIDRKLNEAIELFILLVAEPRLRNQFGIETSQRTIDDIRPVVLHHKPLAKTSFPNIYKLPGDYQFLLAAHCKASNGDCKNQEMDVTLIQHDDRAENREFYKSDFAWREINAIFTSEGIKLFVNSFTVDSFAIDYIKRHPYVHFAGGFEAGAYKLPNGELLTGFQDCILPEHTHKEIVDLAVLLTTGDLELPLAQQLKTSQLQIKQVI